MQNKTRITITLDKTILKKVDRLVGKDRIKNRSHAIETLLSQNLRHNVKKAVILAAGKGVRWRPLTYEIPKALIPIKGKPILEHTINRLKDIGIVDMCVVTGSLGDRIKDYFGDGDRFGVNITYVEDKQESGTAQAIKVAKKFTKKEAFLLWYIDEIADIDLDDLIDFHIKEKGLGTVALSSVSDPKDLGAVKLQGSQITEFEEKPSQRKIESYVVNAGIFIFQPEIFDYISTKTISMEKEIFPILSKENALYGYVFSGKWFDIGTPEIYAKAIKESK
jgi:NDP-sugar pyrophosphorylase family protein